MLYRLLKILILLVVACSAQSKIIFQITGDNKAAEENIRALLPPSFGDDRTSLERYFRSIRVQAQQALNALGYYRYTIDHEVVENQGGLNLVIAIQLGDPMLLHTISVSIKGDLNNDKNFEFPKNLIPEPNSQLNHAEYDNLKNLLRSLAINKGYLDAKLSRHELQIDLARNEANIYLVLNSGKQYFLGETRFGPTKLRESFLKRFIRYKEGAPYSPAKLQKLNLDLQQSGYFRAVRVTADPAEAVDYVIPVDVEFVDRKRNRIDLGGGYSTDLGLNAEINWQNIRLDGMGNQIGGSYAVSEVNQAVTLNLKQPGKRPQTDYFSINLGWEQQYIEDTTSSRANVGGELATYLGRGWLQTFSLERTYEEYTVGSEGFQLAELTIPGIKWQRRVTDGKLDPAEGFNTSLEVKYTSKSFLSTTDLSQFLIESRAIVTPFPKNRLTARVQLGSLVAESFEKVPPSLRFYAGGDQSVRGYDYRSIAPQNEDGDILGGSQLFTGSFEYAYEFIDKWRAAAFVDYGSAFMKWDDMNSKVGVGAGIRWSSPIGQVRLDYAMGISNDPFSYRVHISMGPDL
ncbi:autotransporter assembly complex protein TamA [Gynuella sp.]|uniref:autotransporter assembly complex protein TamA n=1 Tax=Gynuella sp. TaxID=2969146 RepID=UPI003D0C7FC3